MSAFDYHEKDEIVEAIKNFIKYKKEQQPTIQINELVKETMEAVTYGLEHGIWNVENSF